MKKVIWPITASAVLMFVSLAVLAGPPQKLPNHWIVELVDEPTLSYTGENLQIEGKVGAAAKGFAPTAPSASGKVRFDVADPAVVAYAAFLDQRRAEVLNEASDLLAQDVEPIHVYRHVLNGFSVRLPADEAAKLASLPGVREVQPDYVHHPQADAGPGMVGADAVWSGLPGHSSARGEGIVIGIIDSGINWDSDFFADTGHQYTNPFGEQLGLCSDPEVNCNNKLVGVWDHTTEGSKGFDTSGHGSHVASIAAGISRSFGLGGLSGNFNTSGVAPRANIVSYKVCYDSLPDDPDESGCPGNSIIAGLDQAIADGVDVINYSLGGSGTSPWTQTASLRILNFWDAGIPFVSSAGNSGPGFGTVSSPANSPWTFAVASSTHDRWIGRDANIHVGISPRFLLYGSGPSLSSNLSQRPIVDALEVSTDRLACDPFPSGSLTNSVVIVERGECNFVTKVNHAASAGAVAVLVYNHLPGFPIIMGGLDATTIPSAMMTRNDGLEALDAMAGFTNPLVTLTINQKAVIKPEFADKVATYSSRGPGPGAGNVMKPNVIAPGGQFIGSGSGDGAILGASIPNSNSLAFMQGTSMSGPNVAGAVALLRQLHPDWDSAMLQSTLETTAEYEPVTWMDEPANQFERGAGRIRVDRAANAGLFLPLTRLEFQLANPAAGGDPGSLNLSGIYRDQCIDPCTTTRTVEALQGGSWQVSVAGDIDIEVSPASFSLQVGQQQELEITFGAQNQGLPGLLEGRVILTPSNTAMSQQTLSVAFQAVETLLPDYKDIQADANRGHEVLEVPNASLLTEAVYNTSPLVRPTLHEFELEQDPNRNDPYSGTGGTKTFLVEVPENTLILYAETIFSTAPDIDLYVGRDSNGNGQADESEEVCRSVTPDELEECLIENPQPGTWWVHVQNWQASSSGEDDVELEIVVLTADSDDYSLVVSGVGHHEGGPLDLDLYWDQPAMRKDERWVGAVGISSSPDHLADQGIVPVSITRTGSNSPQPTTLFDGQSLPVVFPAGSSHEKLFIDVPTTAEQLLVNIQGDDGVSAQIRSVSFAELAGWAPGTPPPGSTVHASGSGSGDGFELVVGETGDPLVAARYYVVLENSGSEEKRVHVRADLIEIGSVDPIYPGWSPQSRDIFQGIEWRRVGNRFMVWYTYDEDGLPSFYNAVSSNDSDSSVWRANLLRTTSNNVRQTPNTVGEVALTAIDEETLSFAWRLNGAHGSEIMTPDVPLTCPQVDGETVALTGHWFDPGATAGGTTAVVTNQGGAFVRYYFDGEGIGRWVIAPTAGGFEDLDVLDFRGFCPNCPEEDMTLQDNSTVVGLYSVMFNSEDSANETLEMVTDDPLNDYIFLESSIIRISEDLPCQN